MSSADLTNRYSSDVIEKANLLAFQRVEAREVSLNDKAWGQRIALAKIYPDRMDAYFQLAPEGTVPKPEVVASYEGREKELRKLESYKEATAINTKYKNLHALLWPLLNAKGPMRKGMRQIGAVNQFQKIIDPATVKAEDVKLTQSAQSQLEHWRTTYNRWLEGDVLSPELTRDLLEVAADMANAANEIAEFRLTSTINGWEDSGMYDRKVINALNVQLPTMLRNTARGYKTPPPLNALGYASYTREELQALTPEERADHERKLVESKAKADAMKKQQADDEATKKNSWW
jgi:hypothetical protein